MKNIGKTDRKVRIVLGLSLTAAGIILQMTAGQLWWLALPGAVILFTAAVSVCPLYLPFGISTFKK